MSFIVRMCHLAMEADPELAVQRSRASGWRSSRSQRASSSGRTTCPAAPRARSQSGTCVTTSWRARPRASSSSTSLRLSFSLLRLGKRKRRSGCGRVCASKTHIVVDVLRPSPPPRTALLARTPRSSPFRLHSEASFGRRPLRKSTFQVCKTSEGWLAIRTASCLVPKC